MPRWLVFSLLAVALRGAWGVINSPASQALEPLPPQRAVTALYPALTVVLAVPILGDRLDALKVAMILLSLGAGVALTFEGRDASAA